MDGEKLLSITCTGTYNGIVDRRIWINGTYGFNSCFDKLIITIPLHTILTVTSAFLLGKYVIFGERRNRFCIRITPASLCAVILCLELVCRIPSVDSGWISSPAWILEGVIAALSWILLASAYMRSSRRMGLISWLIMIAALLAMAAHAFMVCFTRLRLLKNDILFTLMTARAVLVVIIGSISMFDIGTTSRFYSSVPYLSTTPEIDESEPVPVTLKLSRLIRDVCFSHSGSMMKQASKEGVLNLVDILPTPQSASLNHVQARLDTAVRKLAENTLATHLTDDVTQPVCLRRPSMLPWLWKAFGSWYLFLGVIKLMADGLGLFSPVLLYWLIDLLECKQEPAKYGYVYASALVATSLLGAFLRAHFSYQVTLVALQLRASMTLMIYQKVLRMSSVHIANYSSGQVFNFISSDAERVVNFANSFHQFWTLPIQMVVIFVLLYQQVGLSFLSGICFTLLMIPVNRVIASKISVLSKLMMFQKDQRVEAVSEVLKHIRTLKLLSWESNFLSQIAQLRQAELKSLTKRKLLDALCVIFWIVTPIVISLLTFTVYISLGNQLTAAKVFTCMALFNMLVVPLNALPWVINGLIEARVSAGRISKFLDEEELNLDIFYTQVDEVVDEKNVLSVSEGYFTWLSKNEYGGDQEKTETFMLDNINIKVRQGEFVAVLGAVGSGKSSLLLSILGETCRRKGVVMMRDSNKGVAYVPQEAWIKPGTIRDNILCGSMFDNSRYSSVIEACALQPDLAILPASDLTEIGENGVTLSGGQKARVALARAAYQDTDLYLLDDPFSAVDAHVGQTILEKCLLGLLKDKTRIICTHYRDMISQADHVIVMSSGKIMEQGPPSLIMQSTSGLLPPDLIQGKDVETEDSELVTGKPEITDTLVKEEERSSGFVSSSVYKIYWVAVGHLLSLAVIASLTAMQASRNTSDWWLAHWAALPDNSTISSNSYYLSVYGGILGTNTVATLFRAFLFAYGGIRAARRMHERLLQRVMAAPVSFFEETPIGRLINRFSSDMYSIDDSLPFILNIFLDQLFNLVGAVAVACYALPWFSLTTPLLTGVYLILLNYYRYTSSALKRLYSINLSPLYEHFTQTLSGLPTIRALHFCERFVEENKCRLEAFIRTSHACNFMSLWLQLRLQLVGVALVAIVTFLAVIQHQYHMVDTGLVGLAITYSLFVINILSNVINSFTDTEKELISVERVNFYTSNTPQEESVSSEIDDSWPTLGRITFRNISLVYRPGLPPALKDVNFDIRPGEKIGVCGRTGSGKSSLIKVLFRLVPTTSGSVEVDGRDIHSIPLHLLRRQLSIIPQDPTVFRGSVRFNLDPSGVVSDSSLWNSLEHCHLKQHIIGLGGLDAEISEGACSFSAGQKQLLCLARALVKNSKVICLDEATACVDQHTDSLVQQSLRSLNRGTTLIAIAHRIGTILDSDRVMVMGNGVILEFDTPSALLADPHSHFSSLVQSYHGRNT